MWHVVRALGLTSQQKAHLTDLRQELASQLKPVHAIREQLVAAFMVGLAVFKGLGRFLHPCNLFELHVDKQLYILPEKLLSY